MINDEDTEVQLIKDVGSMWNDPYGFVKYAYPWGTGDLSGFNGPDEWQKGFLLEWGEEIRNRGFDGVNAVMPIQFTTVSGHGIGKSAMAAWICDFIPSTRPHSKGIVTANTSAQLETKTWAEVAKWTKRCITGHWFKVTTGRGAMKKVHKDFPESWRIDALAWQENNPEAFAGQHAANSTPWYLFDEASAIPQGIFDVSKGGLTDGEPMIFLFGNGTKNSGYFFDTHHDKSEGWKRIQVDSRTSMIANKALLNKWIEEEGIDSDFVKIRVLGKFPNQSLAQFIPTDVVKKAITSEYKIEQFDPIVVGVDIGRFGMDPSVIRVRRGRDAKSYPTRQFHGLDTMQMADEIAKVYNEISPDAIFIDGGGVGGGVVDRCNQLNIPVIEVNSSYRPTNRDYRIKGDEMWGVMRDWFRKGGMLDPSFGIEKELTTREYFMDKSNRIALESKDDLKSKGLASPNHADALALTFAYEVGPRDPNKDAKLFLDKLGVKNNDWDYDPYAED